MANAGAVIDYAQDTLADADVDVVPGFRDAPQFNYEPTIATDNMAAVPRFGHSSDFSQLFVKAEVQPGAQQDYIEGLLFVGIFVIAFFTIWSIVLLVFKIWGSCCCCCSSVPGYLAGRPFTLMDEEPNKERVQRWTRRTTFKRILFLIAGLFVVIFSILLVVKGFQQVEQTRSTADVSLDDVRLLVADASILAQDLADVGTSAIDLRDDLVVELEYDRLCPNNPNYLVEDEIGSAINENAGAAIDMLEILGNFATTDVKLMEDGLVEADNVLDDMDSYVEFVADKEWTGIAFVLPLVFLTALMMAGAMAAYGHVMTSCFQLTLTWFVQPLFIAWILIGVILCGGLAISASANADFCSGGAEQTPEATILKSIQNAGLDRESIQFQIARFYLRQCTAEAQVDPFLFLRRHEAQVIAARPILANLEESIAKVDVDTLSFQCGRDFEPLTNSLSTMNAILDALEDAANSGVELLNCERIVPIYAQIVYDGTCDHSVTGLTWMFSCLLVICTMGMIMIMLRSSFQNNLILAESEEPTDEDTEFQGMQRFGHRQDSRRYRHDDYDDGYGDRDDAYDLQLQEHERWKNTTRQDTSDTGSVYTDGNGDLNFAAGSVYTGANGELNIVEVDPPVDAWLQENPNPRRNPTLYDLEETSYDTRGKPKPSAPYEGSDSVIYG